MNCYAHCSTIPGGQELGTTKGCFKGVLDKEDVLHTIYTVEYYSVIRKEDTVTCDNMNEPSEYYAKQK